MALDSSLFVLDRPEVRLLIININDTEDAIHRLFALDRLLLLIPEAPGQVGPVQELGQLLVSEHLPVVFFLRDNGSDIIFAVKKAQELMGRD